jgi:hypothetical protein
VGLHSRTVGGSEYRFKGIKTRDDSVGLAGSLGGEEETGGTWRW